MKKKLSSIFDKYDWINTSFLILSPLIAIAGTTFLIYNHAIRWQTLILTVVWGLITGVAVTGGYHRLFAHKSYEASWFYKFFMLMFGAAAFENSAKRWSSDHRNHHKFVDTDQDPYNIKRGFFYAHMGWVCLKAQYQEKQFENVTDLEKDPLVIFQDKYCILIGILTGFALPAAIASLWGDYLGGFLLAGFTRLVLNHHFTFSINSFCHMLGTQPYSDQNSARDSWFLALFTYGEGYHNFHHKFPSDYRNGIKAYHWDPTKWLIKILSWFGFTSTLRKISDEKILLSKLRMDEKRLVNKIVKVKVPKHIISEELIAGARLKLENAYLHCRKMKAEYERFKEEKLVPLTAQMSEKYELLKQDFHRAQQSFHEARANWGHLCRQFGVRPTFA